MIRGFKTRCENISIQMRNSLQLKKTDALSPEVLAEYFGVMLLEPQQIENLSAASYSLLVGKGRDNWSAVTISSKEMDVIIYNPSHSLGRRASDIMHELSHLILEHSPGQFIVSPNNPFALRSYDVEQENEAAWLSGSLLLPREALVYIKKHRMSNREVCEIYGVSNQLLSYRMDITGVNKQYSN